MTKQRIGALIIGQSPRPDLVEPLVGLLPGCEIILAGALDGMVPEELPALTEVNYPLVTRMGDTTVKVEEAYLESKLQAALEGLENQHVTATILLCAGTFPHLESVRPLFKPFEIGCAILQALGIHSLGLIAPVSEQEKPIYNRWKARRFTPTVWTADVARQDQAFHRLLNAQVERVKFEAILLDYVGHHREDVQRLRKAINLPVLDLGYMAMAVLSSTLGLKSSLPEE